MHIESPNASMGFAAGPSIDAPPGSSPQASPSLSPTWSSAIAYVSHLEGPLIAIGASDFGVELAAGDAVGEGDVLVAPAGTRALIVFEGGATVAIAGGTRAEFHADSGPGGMYGRIVVHSGSLVVDAAAAEASGGTHSSFAIETSAATVYVDDATVALSYARPAGLETVLLSAGTGGDGGATIVNDSGDFVLHHLHAPVAVANWVGGFQTLGASDSGAVADWAPSDPVADGAAFTMALDAPASGVAFETGAGTASPGDVSFVFPEPPRQGFADLPAVDGPFAPPLPPSPLSSSAPPHDPSAFTAFTVGVHAPDALLLYRPATDMTPPLPSPAPPPVRLSGWEPSGHAWDIAGVAGASSGARELPMDPGKPLDLIRPVEGETMAVLEPRHAWRGELEQFLGLPDNTLNTVVDGADAVNGSAIRSQFNVQAGQVLTFDVLFDAVDSMPNNDFAAFTVAGGSHGEAFVISSITATGSLGVTPWQTIRYTAGESGPVTIGFAVLNQITIDGLSRLYIDGPHAGAAGGADGDTYQLAAGRGDAFGGRFELFAPGSPTADGGERVLTSFETGLTFSDRIGRASVADAFHEPDGAHGVYAPTDGGSMAVLHAFGSNTTAIEAFLDLRPVPGVFALPEDADGSVSNGGAATRLSLTAATGDRISFDWMFDAGDQLPDNDYAAFTVADESGSRIFKLSDIRETGAAGASGWQTSVYTVAGDSELTLGFVVINDRLAGRDGDDVNSRLLVDNVRLNRDFGDGYQLADLPAPGALETLTHA